MREKKDREGKREERRRERCRKREKLKESAQPSGKGSSTQPGGRLHPSEFGFYGFSLWLLCCHHGIARELDHDRMNPGLFPAFRIL